MFQCRQPTSVLCNLFLLTEISETISSFFSGSETETKPETETGSNTDTEESKSEVETGSEEPEGGHQSSAEPVTTAPTEVRGRGHCRPMESQLSSPLDNNCDFS